MTVERGVIRNRLHAQQIRDFSGLRYGKITPTDIDAFLEFGDRLFVFVEGKFGEARPPYGQMLAIAKLVDAIHQPPRRYAVAFIASHNSHGDVDYAAAAVRSYRWAGKWRQPMLRDLTVRQAIDRLRARYGTAEVIQLSAHQRGTKAG